MGKRKCAKMQNENARKMRSPPRRSCCVARVVRVVRTTRGRALCPLLPSPRVAPMASFAGISVAGGGGGGEGRLELSPAGAAWAARGGEGRRAVGWGGVARAAWVDAGRGCQLWLEGGDGDALRLEGFAARDFDRVADAVAAASGGAVALARTALAARGQNWGSVRVAGKTLQLLDADGGLVAPLPLAAVAQAALPSSGELELQFLDDDARDREDEVLVEMRLYVPPGHVLPDAAAAADALKQRAAVRGAAAAAGDDDDDEEGDGGGGGGGGAAAALHALVSHSAGITGSSGDAVAEVGEDVGQFLVPRGRFAIELYPTFARLVGKTYEFKVAYKSIARMFYLPKPSPTGDESRYFFVISLDDPLRHGNQRHPHLVMQLERKPLVVPVHVTDEDIRAGRYEGLGKDAAVVEGELPRVVASLFKHITGKPIYKPGAFESASRGKAVRCACKSNDGLLYPLDKSLLFVHKPATWIRYSDVDSVELRRADGGGGGMVSRTWDLVVNTKASAGEAAREVVFTSLDRAERDPLRAFLADKGVKLVEREARATSALAAAMARGGAGAGSDDDDDGGASGHKRARGGDDDDDDDDDDDEEEDDEDFEGDDDSDDDSDDDDDDDDDDSDSDEGSSRKKKKKASSSSSSSSKGKGKDKGKGGKGKGKSKSSSKSSSKSKSASKKKRSKHSDSD